MTERNLGARRRHHLPARQFLPRLANVNPRLFAMP
jgi:hypothetical protein